MPKQEALSIGPYTLSNNLVLAPMAGVTDRPFRQLCKSLGAGLAVSEMVSSNSLLWGSEKTQRRADHTGEVEPKSIQIAGADPRMMAEAAKHMLITAHKSSISIWVVQQKKSATSWRAPRYCKTKH
jgi:tRNA-dihydrouridine synthase